MAFVYHRLFHVLTENGESQLVSEGEWGEKRLTGADLEEFKQDMDAAFNEYAPDLTAGKIVVEDLIESVNVNGATVAVKIGELLTFPGATQRYTFPSHFDKWHALMKQDPNVTFKNPIWVDETA